MEKLENNIEENSDLMNNALYFLAAIYYDRQFLEWNQLEKIAKNFNQNVMISRKQNNWNLKTRKSLGKMAKYLLEIDQYIKDKLSKGNPSLFINEDLSCKTLGEMDGKNHASCYNVIATLSQNMRDCIQDMSFINDYIMDLKQDIISQVMLLKCSYEIEAEIKEELFEQLEILNELSEQYPEDIFRQIKKVQALLDKNTILQKRKEVADLKAKEVRIQQNKEKINQFNSYFNSENENQKAIYQKASTILIGLRIFQNGIIEETVRLSIAKDIFDLNNALISGNIESTQEIISKYEPVFESAMIKSGR